MVAVRRLAIFVIASALIAAQAVSAHAEIGAAAPAKASATSMVDMDMSDCDMPCPPPQDKAPCDQGDLCFAKCSMASFLLVTVAYSGRLPAPEHATPPRVRVSERTIKPQPPPPKPISSILI